MISGLQQTCNRKTSQEAAAAAGKFSLVWFLCIAWLDCCSISGLVCCSLISFHENKPNNPGNGSKSASLVSCRFISWFGRFEFKLQRLKSEIEAAATETEWAAANWYTGIAIPAIQSTNFNRCFKFVDCLLPDCLLPAVLI